MPLKKNSSISNDGYSSDDSKSTSKIMHLENQKLLKIKDGLFEDCGYETPDILDFDENHIPPNAVLIPEFNYKLKPHQVHGIRFLYKACIGSLEKLRQGDPGSGAIIAHNMGLGKTFESIAFISTVFAHSELKQTLSKVLIIVPPKLIQKWESEFEKFCKDPKINVQTVIAERDKKENRLQIIQKWNKSITPTVLIIGNVLYKSADLKEYLQKPDMVFFDEAHQGLKNEKNVIFQVFEKIAPKRRILLTGTPSPNDLLDYYNLVYLANPNLLGTPTQFDEEFKNSIKRGSYKNATPKDIEYMERRCADLKERVKDTVDFQSKEYDKHDFVVRVTLTQPQITLYKDYLEREDPKTGNKAKKYCIADFHIFSHLITHPWLLIRNPEKKNENTEWWSTENIISDKDKFKSKMSNKIEVLFAIIKYCEMVGDKLLIFSQSKIAINYIEELLVYLGKNKKWFVNGHNPKFPTEWGWEATKDYFKINGDVPSSERENFRKKFAEEERARLLLITKQSDGQGVDIPAANRVVIFDIHWNPAVDEQAIFRVCREGQKKIVYVYRLLAEGTMEECIYKRQIVKSSTSKRVHTNAKIENWFTREELSELYKFYEAKNSIGNLDNIDDKSLQHIEKCNPNGIASMGRHDKFLEDIKKE